MNNIEIDEYLFIDGNKRSAGVCSDNNCPCPQVPIPKNTGYFFIEKRPMGFVANLTCEQGARLRNLDLKSAHEDAKMWWKYGRVPARESIKNYDSNQKAPFQNIQTGDSLKTMDRLRRNSIEAMVELEKEYFGNPTTETETINETKPKFIKNKDGYYFKSPQVGGSTFPEIYIPYQIEGIKKSSPPTKLSKPSAPVRVHAKDYTWALVIVAIIVGLIAAISDGGNVQGNLLIVGIYGLGGFIYAINRKSKKEKEAEIENQNKLEIYNQNIDRYQKMQKSEFNEVQILEWRTKKIKDFFYGSITFYPSKEKVLKGKAENYFHKHLIDFFGKDKIITDIEVGNFDRPYVPDFVYYDESKGLKIDIEIDEPYSLSSKKPIHYMYQDDKRNQYFTSKRWCVIRFSEEQIINYPERCCKVIHQELSKLNLHDPSLTQMFKFTENLPPYKKWQKEESEELKDNNFREFILDDRFFKNFEKQNPTIMN